MMNRGVFKGYTQQLGKKGSGEKIKDWYKEKGGHGRIINYVNEEAENFIKKYQILKKQILNVRI